MPADPRRVKELFAAALDLPDEPARRALLDRACAGDEELRHHLEALLRAHDQPQPALDQPLAAPLPTTTDERPDPEPDAILAGRYKLLERIGEGGMGSVWMAQQTEPVKRTVAVKLIKVGGDSKAVLARFEAERQALALMDHPNIAKVLDAGTTAAGQPFFVMELVKGVPITQFCDARKLTPRQRLELFIPVCQAIQHAHQKGIIHRDIKPSNVLIALYDDKPVPKVIDFGVAKATGARLTEETLVTGFGAIVGTPQYMSPEQATLNNLDIDTRSDIYSLGVLLYELLAGSPPFRRAELEKAGLLEILRVIREEEPLKPSTKLSSAEALPSLAANRGTEPAKLTRLLRGEIDWIVMKALDKERARRYETASGMALDIQRYLADEPVVAGPPSALYRLKKFVKRNKGQVIAVSLVLLALLAGLAGTTGGLLYADGKRREAVDAQQAEARRAEGERQAKLEAEQSAAAEKRAKEEAEERLKKIEKGIEILASVFHHLDPQSEEKEGASLRVLLGKHLEEAVRQLEGEAVADPVAVARLQSLLGNSLRELGHYDQAEVVLTKARRTQEASLGAEHLDTLTTKHNLANVYQAQGKYAQAEALYKEVLEGCTTKFGSGHSLTLTTKDSLANLYQTQGKYPQAEALYKEVLAARTAQLGAGHPDTLTTKHNLATLYRSQQKYAQAEALFKEVIEGWTAQQGAEHPQTLVGKNNLAALYQEQGKYPQAEALYEAVLEAQTVKLGAEHPDTLTTKDRLATLCQNQGKYPQAEALFKEVIKGRAARLGADHPDTLTAKHGLAVLYMSQRKYPEAEALYKEVVENFTATLGAKHPDTLSAKSNLGSLYRATGKYPQAEALLKEVVEGQTAARGAEHRETLGAKHSLALLYEDEGKYPEAEALLKEVVAGCTAQLGADHPDTLTTKQNLAVLYRRMEKLEPSVALLEEVVEQRKKQLGAGHPDTLLALSNLGVTYRDAGRLDDAIRCLEEALDGSRQFPNPKPAQLAQIPATLARAYDLAKQYAKSEPLYREFLQLGRKKYGDDDPRTAGLMAALALNLLLQKKHAEAETVLRDCLRIREQKQPDEWGTFNTKSMLAEALLGQKKYVDAEPLLKDGYDGLKQRRDKIPEAVRKLRLTEALQRLVQLYEATDHKDEAAKWRKELDAVKRP